MPLTVSADSSVDIGMDDDPSRVVVEIYEGEMPRALLILEMVPVPAEVVAVVEGFKGGGGGGEFERDIFLRWARSGRYTAPWSLCIERALPSSGVRCRATSACPT